MAVLCCEGNISERCRAAGELLAALKKVPTNYMLAISSPLVSLSSCGMGLSRVDRSRVQLHHLAGIGNLLGGVVQGPLTFNSYLEVRQTL
jgi:hypothetical protein